MSLTEDDLIDRFLKGELSNIEARDFRKRMESNQELAQRVAFEKQLLEVLSEEEWHHSTNPEHPEVAEYTKLFASEETARIKEAIANSQEAYRAGSLVRRLRPLWMYASAAAVLLLISFYFIFPGKNSPEALYSSYLAKTELPSVTSRGSEDTNDVLARAQQMFNEKAYTEVSTLLTDWLEEYQQNSAVYIYLALSEAEQSRFDEATTTIDRLIGSDLLDSEKGYWFKSLIKLKANQSEEAKKLLQMIVEKQYFNYTLAEKLLAEL